MSAQDDKQHESAVTRVLNTTELCEHIFHQLPPGQLLAKVPRVCKQWKALFDKSITLQRKLFFEPTARIDIDEACDPNCCNPFVDIIYDLHGTEPISPSAEERLLREDASWRRMLFDRQFTLPFVLCARGTDFRPLVWIVDKSKAAGYDGKGMRLGDMYDMVSTQAPDKRDHPSEHPKCEGFKCQWRALRVTASESCELR